MGVLSNKNHHFTELCIRYFFPSIAFDVVQGYMSGVPHKPDPAGALIIAEKMGVECRDIIFLGDSAVDMATAIAADMHGVGALWGFRTDSELIEAGASALLTTPGQLLELIGLHI
jgi:phosphoglycolate phosphatase